MIAGRYRVEREIGRGGMATVYLCTDIKEHTQVAVKVLRAELGSAVVVERFLREIAFAQELDHPQIPKVMDSGLVGALPYYVMTYIEGISLRAHLDKVKQLPLEEAIHITAEVAKPTAYAHARGIVHRDIKPANILLSPNGVYVLDFGVARAILASADDSLTSTGVAVGTPAYMSPEQALADDNLDSRSDIYSLGCVLYEMIAGIPPFVGATPQSVMSRRFIAPPPPLHEVRDLVPPEVEAAVMRALTKSPADRFQKVQDLADALLAPRQPPTLQTQQVKLASNKRRNTIGLIIGGVAVAAVMGAFAWSIASRDYVAHALTSVAQWDFKGATEQLQTAVKRSPDDATAQLWLAQLKMLHGDPVADWRRYALRAADGAALLSTQDKRRAAALVAYSADELPDPCAGFRTMVKMPLPRSTEDFTSALSLAECLTRDRAVVPDRKSSTGFAFRASYNQAATLYEGLIARHSTDGGAYAFIIPRLEKIRWTSKNKLRGGALITEEEKEFIAWPELVADTLSFVPVPVGGDNVLRQNVAAVDRFIARNIDRLSSLAVAWTKAAPADPEGHETLARMLETSSNLDGPEPNALGEIGKARSAAATAPIVDGETFVRNLGFASTHVRFLLKVHRFDAAAAIADSAGAWKTAIPLSDSLQSVADNIRVGLFSLTGHLQSILETQRRYADQYVIRFRSGEARKPPLEIAVDANKLELYANFGVPRDSIVNIVARLAQNITAVFPPGQVTEVRTSILTRPLNRAAPSIGLLRDLGLGPTNDMFANALTALAANDLKRARSYANAMGALYAERAPGEVTMDAVLQYAWLRAQVGDSTTAARFLDDALRGLSRAPPTMLQSAHIPASLARAMILRSLLAKKAGDADVAALWARSARQLWGKGDPVIAAIVREL